MIYYPEFELGENGGLRTNVRVFRYGRWYTVLIQMFGNKEQSLIGLHKEAYFCQYFHNVSIDKKTGESLKLPDGTEFNPIDSLQITEEERLKLKYPERFK